MLNITQRPNIRQKVSISKEKKSCMQTVVSETSVSVANLFPLFPCSAGPGTRLEVVFHYLPVLYCLTSLAGGL